MRIRLWIVGALCGLLVSGGMAAGQDAVRAQAVKEPSAAEIRAATPQKAVSAGIEGEAIIRCTVLKTGLLTNCSIAAEAPADYGLGDAAIKLIPKFEMKPAMVSGFAAESLVSLTVEFPCVGPCRPDQATGVVLPRIVSGPEPDDIYRAWPPAARATSVEGSVQLECTVTTAGRLEQCRVAADPSPSGSFGASALSLASLYRYAPATRNGEPVPAIISVRVEFQCDARCPTFKPPEAFSGPLISGLNWARTPSLAEIQAVYPKGALSDRDGGIASLFCYVRPDGGLRNCAVQSEEPKGRGFGRAASQLTSAFESLPLPASLKSQTAGVQLRIGFSPANTPGQASLARTPGPAEFAANYPKQARDGGAAGGRATLACTVSDTGSLRDCRALGESPAGMGFGDAAIRLAPYFAATLWSEEGLPTAGGSIRIPIRFERPTPPVAEAVRAVVTNPDWERQPSAADMSRLYPERAMRMRTPGRAVISCTVLATGSLEKCSIVEEAPLGQGFGAAGLRMVPYFKMKPETRNGESVGGATVQIPIIFQGG